MMKNPELDDKSDALPNETKLLMEVLDLHKINLFQSNAIKSLAANAKSKTIYDKLRENGLKLRTAVKTADDLYELIGYLKAQSKVNSDVEVQKVLDCIIELNGLLKPVCKRLLNLKIPHTDLSSFILLLDGLKNTKASSAHISLSPDDRKALSEVLTYYVQQDKLAKGFLDLVCPVSGSYKIREALDVLTGCQLSNSIVLENVCKMNETAMFQLVKIYQLHAPETKFPGFLAWGIGDSNTKNAADNLRNHFLKHVCCLSAKDTFPDEGAWWWKVLDVKFTKEECTSAKVMPESITKLESFGVENFLKAKVLESDKNLLTLLITKYEVIYRDYALKASANLTIVSVTLLGDKVIIGGCTNDGIFIFGRHTPEDKGLAMSSCYYATDKTTKLNDLKSKVLYNLK